MFSFCSNTYNAGQSVGQVGTFEAFTRNTHVFLLACGYLPGAPFCVAFAHHIIVGHRVCPRQLLHFLRRDKTYLFFCKNLWIRPLSAVSAKCPKKYEKIFLLCSCVFCCSRPSHPRTSFTFACHHMWSAKTV